MLRRKMVRDIKQNLSQFITIFLMVFIGVMAYSGIESYMEGMKQTANNFYGDYNLQDLNVMGALSEKDLDTIENIDNVLKQTKTVFLNGPAGAFEYDNFSYGTKEVLKSLKNSSAKVVIGGGDSASAAIKFGYKNSFYHIFIFFGQ